MEDQKSDQIVTLGGVRFTPTPDDEMVFEQYGYAQKAASEAGLGQELMETFDPFVQELVGERGEMTEREVYQMVEKALMRSFQGRAYLQLLAAVLVQEGQEWTLEGAKRNVEFFSRLKGNDIQKMHQILIIATLGFFTSGLKSIATSQSSSKRKAVLETVYENIRRGQEESSMEEVTLSPKTIPDGAVATGNTET